MAEGTNGGYYDDFLTASVDERKKAGESISQGDLRLALKRQKGLDYREAHGVVQDYLRRGQLQARLGPGLYDDWLTNQIDAARVANRGVSAQSLARRLRREYPGDFSDPDFAATHANDLVEEYFARYALKSTLGPPSLTSLLVTTSLEQILFLPLLWGIYSLLFYGVHLSRRPTLTILLVSYLSDLVRNWRRVRSSDPWETYDAVRPHIELAALREYQI